MSKVILGHPYSGALYGYISDQMSPQYAHTNSIGRHDYYTTLYGKNYKKYVDLALMLSLIYDNVYLTPADNHWPESPTSKTHGVHPELGFHAEWATYSSLFSDTNGRVQSYLNDKQIKTILTKKFRIPESSQLMIVSSILYELNLSRLHRCPIICSFGRKTVIERIIEIDKPAIHPTVLNSYKVELINDYMSVTGLFLAPTNLEDLIRVKPEHEVRDYAKKYLNMLENFQKSPTISNKLLLLDLAKNAIEQQKISNLISGLFNWASSLFRLINCTPASVVSKGGSMIATWSADNAEWYEFSGVISKATNKAALIKNIEDMERKILSEAECPPSKLKTS